MTDEMAKILPNLLNLSEREREIIIDWGEAVLDEWGMSEEQKALLKRFIDWKVADEVWKRRKAELKDVEQRTSK